MFKSCVDNLRRDVTTLKAVLTTHDQLRQIVYDPAGARTAVHAVLDNPLRGVMASLPPLFAWRIYDHCAAFTRLYAIYEQCVVDLVGEWLNMLPELFPTYADLPEAVRTGHRIGVSEILGRLAGDRYGHLSEQSTLSGISDGVRGVFPYCLLTDAFLIDDQNLRRETLAKLLTRVGLPDAWGWICNHGDIQKFLQEIRGGQNTVDGELRDFVFLRNEAAHGAVAQVVALDEIEKIADFVTILCDVIAQLFTRQAIDRRMFLGRAKLIGRVFRQFSDRVVAIHASGGRIRVGETVIVRREQSCFTTTIETMEVNRERFEELLAKDGDQIGLCLGRTAKLDSEILRLSEESVFAYQI